MILNASKNSMIVMDPSMGQSAVYPDFCTRA